MSLKSKFRTEQAGFTFIELLFVVGIIGILTSIAVPGFRRARQQANTGSAIQSLRTIATSEYMYARKTGAYATLSTLSNELLIQGDLTLGYKSGYVFSIEIGSDITAFSCTATPDSDVATLDHFFVDQTGVIRYRTGAAADATSEPIPR